MSMTSQRHEYGPTDHRMRSFEFDIDLRLLTRKSNICKSARSAGKAKALEQEGNSPRACIERISAEL